MRRGDTPMMSSRLSHEYRDKLDRIAAWLHETRGLPNSRRTAIEYMIDLAYYGGEFERDNKDRDESRSPVSTT
jgi:hypothetical protein